MVSTASRARARSSRLVFLAAFVSCVGAFGSLWSQSAFEVPDGFQSDGVLEFDGMAPFAEQLGGIATTRDGGVIVYVGGEVTLHTASGERRVLETFRDPVFGSFLQIEPTGESVLFGESSTHGIWRLPLDGSGGELVDTIPNNFDLAIVPATAPEELRGRAAVSGTGTSLLKNVIWWFDEDPNSDNRVLVQDVSDFSGPLTFDSDGNLWYSTADSSLDGSPMNRLLRFEADLLVEALEADATLSLDDAVVVFEMHDGWFDLVYLDGRLWGSNLGYGSQPAGLEVFHPRSDAFPRSFAPTRPGEALVSPTYLSRSSGTRAFRAGRGPLGGRLLVAATDFASVSVLDAVAPELWFVRGDVNDTVSVNLSDGIALLDFLFVGRARLPTPQASDINFDGATNVSDVLYLLNFLFQGGPTIAAPFPEPGPLPEMEVE